MRYAYKLVIAISLYTYSFLFGATIGSDTSPSRINTQQLLQNGDRVAGFVALAGGFNLLGMSTSATFDCFFGVSGRVALNAGTLILNRDLIIQNVATLESFGNITGNNHIWNLSSSISRMPLGQPIDCSVTFTSSTATANAVLAEDWSYTDTLLAVGLQTGGGANELAIYAFNNGGLILKTSLLLSDNVNAVAWHPARNTLAVGINNSAGGAELFIYTFDGSTLTQTDSDEFGADVTSIKWNPASSYLAVGSAADAAEVVIYPFNGNNTLDKTNKFTLNIAGSQNVGEVDWNVTGSFLAIARDDLYVYQFSPLPSITMTLNATAGLSTQVNTVSWNMQFPTLLAAGLQSVSPRLRIFDHNSTAGTLTQVASDATNLGNAVRAVQWDPVCGNCLALAKETGAGPEFRIYVYDPIAATLTIVSSFDFGNHVASLRWMRSGSYIANGSLTDLISIYQGASTMLPSCFVLSNLNMYINTDVTLEDVCLTFSGNCALYGSGNRLILSSDATINIASNSRLLLSNIVIQGVNDSKLQPLDNTVTLSLEDMVLALDGNFSFTQGSFDIVGDVSIQGANKIFSYRTTQSSTIQAGSSLILDAGLTFSYAPTNNANSLLQCIDKSSQLKLNGATLFATAVGLNLTKGTLFIDGLSALSSDGANTSQAISFGDGINSSNNMNIEFLPAGVLSCSGFIVDNNI